MISILIGLAAGFIHVLAGPDHLAATAPLALKSKKQPWLIGFRWGLGHTLGVIIVGFLALLLKEFINIELLSSYCERFVGIILLGIGLWGFYSSSKKKVHAHSHTHDGEKHVHAHLHTDNSNHSKANQHIHTHAALSVGIIHGLAGSSHLFGVLPALAFPTMFQASVYLLFFGFGTIAAMMLFSFVIGYVGKRFENFGIKSYRILLNGFNSFAIIVGTYWLVII